MIFIIIFLITVRVSSGPRHCKSQDIKLVVANAAANNHTFQAIGNDLVVRGFDSLHKILSSSLNAVNVP